MKSKEIMQYMIIFNVTMGVLLFLSSEYMLVSLTNRVAQEVNIFTDTGIPYYGTPPPLEIRLPMPNFPFFVFLFTSAVNVIFIIKLWRNKETS
jgi:hypothetical protein